MENWSFNEIVEYRLSLQKKYREVRKGMKWYHSRQTKKLNKQILESIDSECEKVEEEARRRFGSI